jgi:dihydropteroate synthase
MASSSLFPKKSFLNIRGELYTIDTPKVMGILNITPDSFYDGGKYTSEKDQLLRVEKMLNEGADFIDIGAQSSRPGAQEIGAEKEIAMLCPTIESIRNHFPDTILSIDTWHAKVAKSAYNFGADIINDISGGTFDKEMFRTILELQIPYILMHTGDRPEVMQNNPIYENVLKEVIYFMSKQIAELNLLGVNDIIIDPGFGFGKTLEHNYELLKNLNHFSFLEAPILVGISRKSMIYKYLNLKPDDSLNSTTALNMIALKNGADILRVHDVKEAKECVELWKLLK